MNKTQPNKRLSVGKKRDISQLVNVFEHEEGVIEQIIGKTGNGKTYEGTRRALADLHKGRVVYTTWQLILPEYYDERENKLTVLKNILLGRKTFYKFDYKKNWHYLDIDRPDLVEYVANLTDCIVYLDEGQDVFDSYEGRAMSAVKRKSLTRTRHLRKTLVIISQRAQAVAVTARANVTFFYKCVKTRAWFWPFVPYFKVYRTEDMDENNFPIWESGAGERKWKASVWYSGFPDKRVYNAYNSWYLREGIKKSQEVNFEAYDVNWLGKLYLLFRKHEEAPMAFSDKELVEKARKKQIEHEIENQILTRPKSKRKLEPWEKEMVAV